VDQTTAEVRASGTFGSMPLSVLTATEHGFPLRWEQLHQQLQAELVALSSNSRQHIVTGATHVSLVDNREQAQITVQSIKEILKASTPGARRAARASSGSRQTQKLVSVPPRCVSGC
jgi:hypothetical protein